MRSPWETGDRQPAFVRVSLESGSCTMCYSILILEAAAAAAAKSLQPCPTLCDPIDGSPLGFSVPGIAISFSNA